MRPIRLIALCTVVAVALAGAQALAATKRVGVRKAGDEFRFTPSSVSIRTGDTVRWSWKGRIPHNVKGPGFQSTTANRLTYSRRFDSAGRFRVICTIHRNQGQTMTVRVR